MKKVIGGLFSFIAFCFVFQIISFAANTGVVNTETLRVRKEASKTAEVVTLLSADDNIEIISEDGEWYKIKHEEYTGYVHKDYIKLKDTQEEVIAKPVEEEEEETAETNVQETENSNQNEEVAIIEESITSFKINSEKVLLENTKLYILPLMSSSEIASLEKNSEVIIADIMNDWIFVYSNNISGWIRSSKLGDVEGTSTLPEVAVNSQESNTTEENNVTKVGNDETTENNETLTITPKKGYINYDGVNLRKEDSTSSEIITVLYLNKEVEVISEEGDWAKVKVDNKEGYISKKLISEIKVEVTSRSQNETRILKEENIVSQENNTNLGQQIVDLAKTYLGYRYVLGGKSPSTGFDCAGFTKYIYSKFGYTLNSNAPLQNNNGVNVSKENLQLGDLVIFNNSANTSIGHVGIYIGNNSFIHASNPNDGVKITSLSTEYYTKRYVTSKRII